MDSKSFRMLHIGDYAEKTDTVVYENAEIYAALTGDYNPLHFETEEAYRSRYKRPIVHGMILAGFISGLIGTVLPGSDCIYEMQSLEFHRPVFYNDTIHTRITVVDTDVSRNRVTLQTECFNQLHDLVLSGKAIVLPQKE